MEERTKNGLIAIATAGAVNAMVFAIVFSGLMLAGCGGTKAVNLAPLTKVELEEFTDGTTRLRFYNIDGMPFNYSTRPSAVMVKVDQSFSGTYILQKEHYNIFSLGRELAETVILVRTEEQKRAWDGLLAILREKERIAILPRDVPPPPLPEK